MPHWLDEAVNRAMDSGAFENLKGQGKPLNLDGNNPYEDPSMRLANRVLKEAGYTLPWIADRNELLDACNNAKQQLLRGWQHAQYQGQGAATSAAWRRTADQLREVFADLNRRIRDFNIGAPTEAVHISLLNIDREIACIQGE